MFKLLFWTLLCSVLVSYLILWAREAFSFKLKLDPSCHASKKPKKTIPRSSLKPQEWTLNELRQHNGVDKKELLIAVDWRVFDVSSSPKVYGPGGTYGYLAGRDASRSIVFYKELELNAPLQEFDDYLDFTSEQRDSLNDWVDYFYSKYPEVGLLVSSKEAKSPKEDTFSKMGDHPMGGFQDNLVFSTGINH